MIKIIREPTKFVIFKCYESFIMFKAAEHGEMAVMKDIGHNVGDEIFKNSLGKFHHGERYKRNR